MKKYLTVFMLFFIQFNFCQEFRFDIYSCYFNNNQNINSRQAILTSEFNENIKVILNQKNNYFIGAIQEFTKDSLFYHFIEVRIDSTNGFDFQSKYKSSMKFKLNKIKNCFDKNNIYEILNIEKKNQLNISRFKNPKRRQKISNAVLNTSIVNFNFFDHFNNGYLSTQFLDCQSLAINKNILIKKIAFTGNINYNLTLVDYKNIPIIINIDKIIYDTKK